MSDQYPIPTSEQLAALAQYRAANGRTWKSKLIESWYSSNPPCGELQAIRNTFGPRWLKHLPQHFLDGRA